MNAREELAERIKGEISHHISPVIGWLRLDAAKGVADNDAKRHDAWLERLDKAAESIAEMVKPRTITTVAELDALPNGSVILDPSGISLHKNEFTGWRASNGAKGISLEMLAKEALPATVLHGGQA